MDRLQTGLCIAVGSPPGPPLEVARPDHGSSNSWTSAQSSQTPSQPRARAAGGRARRTAGVDARLMRRKALRLRSGPAISEVAKSVEPPPRVPIHAVRLQPLVANRSSAESSKFCSAPIVPERVVAGHGGKSCSYRSTGRLEFSEKHHGTEQLEEARSAELVVPKGKMDANRKLWKRNRKKFWAHVGASLLPELVTTLRQQIDVCVKSTKRGDECDLNLCNSRLGDEGTHVLGLVLAMGEISLASINLFGNSSDAGPVTEVGFKGIADAIRCRQAGDRLKKIVVSRNAALGDGGMALLADALPAAVALTHLDVSNTGFGDTGLIAIATALGRKQTTQTSEQSTRKLSVPSSRPSAPVEVVAATNSTSIPCITPVAVVGANLVELILYGNEKARGQGWTSLADVLPQLSRLRRLDCSQCAGMGCDGADAIAAVLPRCKVLQCLLVARCTIGDRGGRALATAFATIAGADNGAQQAVKSIDASWNRLTGECAKAIVNTSAAVGWAVEQTPGGFRNHIKRHS